MNKFLQVRKKLRYSQGQFAKILGHTQSHLCRVESNKVQATGTAIRLLIAIERDPDLAEHLLENEAMNTEVRLLIAIERDPSLTKHFLENEKEIRTVPA